MVDYALFHHLGYHAKSNDRSWPTPWTSTWRPAGGSTISS